MFPDTRGSTPSRTCHARRFVPCVSEGTSRLGKREPLLSLHHRRRPGEDDMNRCARVHRRCRRPTIVCISLYLVGCDCDARLQWMDKTNPTRDCANPRRAPITPLPLSIRQDRRGARNPAKTLGIPNPPARMGISPGEGHCSLHEDTASPSFQGDDRTSPWHSSLCRTCVATAGTLR
jgi:hypothetical protein